MDAKTNNSKVNENIVGKANMILPMNQPFTIFLCSLLFGVTTLQAEPTTVNIAAVNNPAMLELKKLEIAPFGGLAALEFINGQQRAVGLIVLWSVGAPFL